MKTSTTLPTFRRVTSRAYLILVSMFAALLASCSQQQPQTGAPPVDTSQFSRKQDLEKLKEQIDRIEKLINQNPKTSEKEGAELKDLMKSLSARIDTQERVAQRITEGLSDQTNSFQALINYLNTELPRQQNATSNLAWQFLLLKLKSTDNSEALFDASESSGFSRVDSTSGFFLVSLKNVEPYLDGYKLTLNVGNPLSATYESLKFNVIWGKKLNSADSLTDANAYSKWEKTLRNKEVTIADKLQPGAWNKVTLVLSPAKSDELGHIKIRLNAGQVSLRKPTEN